MWQAEVGGLRFRPDEAEYFATRAVGADASAFERIVTRSWLPAIYPAWGRQVLHAGAILDRQTGRAIGLVGPTGTGKSTLSYALGRRAAWQVIADDTMAFTCEPHAVTLYPVRADLRLRPRTAAHYGLDGEVFEPVDWPAGPVTLAGLYFLVPREGLNPPLRITPVPGAERYTRTLAQAFALTLDLPEHNRELMLAYAELASMPGFDLEYQQSFDQLESVLDGLAVHARALAAGGSVRRPTGRIG